MEINDFVLSDFEDAWDDSEEEKQQVDPLNLSTEQLNETTDNYKLNDAHAYYRHVAVLTTLYYNARLGEPMVNLFAPIDGPREYVFEFKDIDDEAEDGTY